ncbi:PASTA domain-containing protein [Planomonospora sp. ID82291]|uniref:PASTA domain-containing protein n=1 Tax=Planomonospora sp. ID82291 TaxID=2738136 RepID=UPI0018C3F1A3|nr:PASTA domain-containing protein [Planomonospora sp. ID82291]MBG0814230.1 PASTA domain-containing protein [Planomonospora sp. ID82291]
MTYQPSVPPPARHGFSGAAVALIAVLALGAGCLGGVAVGSAGGTTDTAAPSRTVGAKAAQAAPEDTGLPEAGPDKPEYIKLPDFKGQNAAVAKQWLVDQGWNEFKNIKLGSQDSFDTMVLLPENWTVTKQSHRPGSKVKIGSTIVLTCTKGS